LTLFKKEFLGVKKVLRNDMLNLLKRDYFQMQGKLIRKLPRNYQNNLN